MQVQALARVAQVTPDTIRHYTRMGLLTPQKNPANGYKEYAADDLQRLRFIVRARDLGFSLSDVQAILERADQGGSPCPAVREIISQRLVEVKRKLDDMTQLYDRMNKAVAEWSSMPDEKPCGRHVCHLIEAVSLEADAQASNKQTKKGSCHE